MIEIVIKIPEAAYKILKSDKGIDWLGAEHILNAVANGTPLPKGQSILAIDTPKTCGDCPLCIYTAKEKRAIGYCNASDQDYYCKMLNRFMEYDEVDDGVDILGKPSDCPLEADGGGEDGDSN